MADIKLDNVSKSFGSVAVIENLNLVAQSGEFLVLLGPSGSGKTTILRMIAGLETIDQGTLEIDGVRCEQLPPGQRNVAMVFQNYALYPHMTVTQNLAFGLENIGLDRKEIDARVLNAARMLEMEPLLARRPAQLSGGQRQRVAIGRAIVKQPKAFLFDEPLSNLDAALRMRTRVELAELHQRMKTTMVYVTHDQIEAMTLADRIVVLNNRRIEQIGTPMQIYHTPATRFVAGFVGSPAMNFMAVEVVGTGADQRIDLGNGKQIQLRSRIERPGKFELGFRPESVHIVRADADIEGTIAVVERLGERSLLHVRRDNGATLVAQDSGTSRASPGEPIGLKLDPAQVHLFDDKGNSALGTLMPTASEILL
jgi:multiple sugar transport system ATP-binding protein